MPQNKQAGGGEKHREITAELADKQDFAGNRVRARKKAIPSGEVVDHSSHGMPLIRTTSQEARDVAEVAKLPVHDAEVMARRNATSAEEHR